MRHASAFAFAACCVLVAVGVGSLSGRAQQPGSEHTGAISGVVVDGTTGRPMRDAAVTLRAIGGQGPARRQGRQLTDELGRFVFSRLPAPEDFDLTVSKNGYLPGAFGQGSVESLISRRIVLGAGEWFADARIVIWRPGAVSGRVVDEVGEPVVEAVVRVVAHVLVAGRPYLAMAGIARTDDLGQYRISGLQPGRYLVSVPSVQSSVPAGTPGHIIAGGSDDEATRSEAMGRGLRVSQHPLLAIDQRTHRVLGGFGSLPVAGGRGRAYPTTFHPGVASLADAAPVEIGAGQERTGIDLRLVPVPAVRVTGRVEGPGQAISGLTVRLVAAGAEAVGLGHETATALVAPDGTFAMADVPAGRYTLIASHVALTAITPSSSASDPIDRLAPPGFAPRGGGTAFSAPGIRHVYSSGGGPVEWSWRQTITVGATDVTDLTVVLRDGASIAGRIVWDMSPGAGAPPTSTVRAWPANGDASLGFPSGRTTAQDPSSFVLHGFQPDEYLLDAYAPGGGMVKSIVWQGEDYATRPVDLRSGRSLSGVVITLTTEAAMIAGTVRTPAGAVGATNAVLCFPVDRAQWNRPRPEGTLRSTWGLTRTNGSFRLGPLRAGEYFVIAVDRLSQHDLHDPAFLATAAPLASRVTLEWGKEAFMGLTIQSVPVRR
jgi:hypothetical protein